MTIHAFKLWYSPSSDMDKLVSDVLDQADEWSLQDIDYPQSRDFRESDYSDKVVSASGFSNNRFEWVDKTQEPQEDACTAIKEIINNIDQVNSLCDWWVLKWHKCYHDESKDCTEWVVLDSSNNYSEVQDVPEEVIK